MADYGNSLVTNYINRAGTSQVTWGPGFRMGFGSEVSAPVFGGGMVFGPTPDQQLGGLTDLSGGRTAGSRNLSRLRFGGDLFSGYADRASHGMTFGAKAFMSGGPLWSGSAAPVFPGFGMGGMGAQPGAAPYAGPAAAPMPASSINAATPAKDVDETESKDDADKIEKLKDEYLLSDHGFTDTELKEIFGEIEKASEGNYTKFRSLLQTLPKKSFNFKEPELDEEGKPRGPSIDQQKAEWVKKYGEWHAKNIARVDGTKVAQLVRDTASGEGVTMQLEKAPTPGSGFNRFKVTGVDGNSDVSPGDYLYYDPKSKNFYRTYDVQKKEFGGLVGPASETPVDGARSKDSVTLTVGGGSDYIELTPDGTISMNDKEKGDANVVDSYRVGDTKGTGSDKTVEDIEPVDGNYYVMNDGGRWFYTSKTNEEGVADIPAAHYADGRLYLNKGGSYDPTLADDAVAYTAKLREAEEKLPGRVDAAKGEKVDQDHARVEQAWKQLEEMMGAEKSKVTHEYDPATKVLTIHCKPEDAKAVRTALQGTDPADSDGAKAREKQGNAILAELPRGAKVRVNEAGAPFMAHANGFNRLKVELGRWEPKAVTIDANIDMSYLRNSKDARAAVQARIEREIEKSLKDCYKPISIAVTGKITLPEGKIDQKTWDEIVAELEKKYKEKYGCGTSLPLSPRNIISHTAGFTRSEKTLFDRLDKSVVSAFERDPQAVGVSFKDRVVVPHDVNDDSWCKVVKALAEKHRDKWVHFRHVHFDNTNDDAEVMVTAIGSTSYSRQDYDAVKSNYHLSELGSFAVVRNETTPDATPPASAKPATPPERVSSPTPPPATKAAAPTVSTASEHPTIDLKGKTKEQVKDELTKRVKAANETAGTGPMVTISDTIELPSDMTQGQWDALAKELAKACPNKALVFKHVHITKDDKHLETTVIGDEVTNEQKVASAAMTTTELDAEKTKALRNVEAKMMEAEQAARQLMAGNGSINIALAKCSDYAKATDDLAQLIAKYSEQKRDDEATSLRALVLQHRLFKTRLSEVRGNTTLEQWRNVEAAHPRRKRSAAS